MHHFLEISHLSRTQIESLLDRAFAFKRQGNYPNYSHAPVALLFYENSTRTRVSFELAATHLSMPVIALDLQSSSEAKGESIADTIKNLAAMGIGHYVIRHQQNGLHQKLANELDDGIQLINAGDGTHAHPSQALLDMMTIIEHKPKLEQLKMAILGNIRHSRVASSLQCIAKTMGVGEVNLIAPEAWQPQPAHYGQVTDNLREGLKDADVVVCLRVQKERLMDDEHLDLATYRNDFALTAKSLAYAKPNAIVMHPGPMNRGVEIDSDIADGSQSVILQQVTNGVFARMSIFDALVNNRTHS